MGFLVVSAVLVVSFGRLGDMFGRVRMYNLGFAIFSVASIFLTVTWMHGTDGALWLIIWRIVQGIGGAFLFANSDRDPHRRVPGQPARHRPRHELDRGHRRFVHRPASSAASSAPINWHLVFLVSAPIGALRHRLGVLHAARHRRCASTRRWTGGATCCSRVGPGRDPGRHHLRPAALRRPPDGLDQPVGAGRALRRRWPLLVIFVFVETKVAEPLFRHLAVQDPGVRGRATSPT